MTTFDRTSKSNDDQAFERALSESARTDVLPTDTAQAWTRLSSTIALTSQQALGAPQSSDTSLAHVAQSGAPVTTRHVVKWLLIGALGGSALTAVGFVMWGRDRVVPTSVERAPMPPARVMEAATPAPVTSDASPVIVSPTSLPTATPIAAPALVEPNTRVRRAGVNAAPKPDVAPLAIPIVTRSEDAARSTLAEQVTLVDAARAALVERAFTEALRLTDRYRAMFPEGELTPEAEVVAIEALAGHGEHAAVRIRATRFLREHPSDPHAAKIRALIDH